MGQVKVMPALSLETPSDRFCSVRFIVTIVDEGQTMSVEDMMTENVMSYMARDIELMTSMMHIRPEA